MGPGTRGGTREGVAASAAAGDLAVAALSAAALGAAAMGTVFGADAARAGPVLCPLRLVTAFPCPFCGLTRSLLAAGDGRFGLSFELSPLGLVALPLAALLLVLTVVALVRGRRVRWPRVVLPAGGALVVSSWVVQLMKGAT